MFTTFRKYNSWLSVCFTEVSRSYKQVRVQIPQVFPSELHICKQISLIISSFPNISLWSNVTFLPSQLQLSAFTSFQHSKYQSTYSSLFDQIRASDELLFWYCKTSLTIFRNTLFPILNPKSFLQPQILTPCHNF